MEILPLGDRAYLLRNLRGSAAAYADWLNSNPPAGLEEAVAAYDTVGVYVDPDLFDVENLHEPDLDLPAPGQLFEIPVAYDGEDLAEAADRLGITQSGLVEHHTSMTYDCFAIGFCPGFPYLGYLPAEISGLPRRDQPRVRVPAGSVAITGRQTGIYPLERPGGWWLIGRTDFELVNLDRGFFALKAGDRVRFCEIR